MSRRVAPRQRDSRSAGTKDFLKEVSHPSFYVPNALAGPRAGAPRTPGPRASTAAPLRLRGGRGPSLPCGWQFGAGGPGENGGNKGAAAAAAEGRALLASARPTPSPHPAHARAPQGPSCWDRSAGLPDLSLRSLPIPDPGATEQRLWTTELSVSRTPAPPGRPRPRAQGLRAPRAPRRGVSSSRAPSVACAVARDCCAEGQDVPVSPGEGGGPRLRPRCVQAETRFQRQVLGVWPLVRSGCARHCSH